MKVTVVARMFTGRSSALGMDKSRHRTREGAELRRDLAGDEVGGDDVPFARQALVARTGDQACRRRRQPGEVVAAAHAVEHKRRHAYQSEHVRVGSAGRTDRGIDPGTRPMSSKLPRKRQIADEACLRLGARAVVGQTQDV